MKINALRSLAAAALSQGKAESPNEATLVALGLPDGLDIPAEYELIKQKASKLSSRQRRTIVSYMEKGGRGG